MNPRKTVPRDPEQYHHGDLRRALLQAAERLIEQNGLEAFTLRACAREAGVSHAAPAHHFRDRRALLAALAAEAFGRMGLMMDAYTARAGLEGQPLMPALGMAYIDFALRHPGLYRLMFRIEAVDRDDPVLKRAAEACHARLSDAVRQVASDPGNAAEVEAKAAVAWSVVHGFASLVMEGHFAGDGPEGNAEADPQAFASRMLAQLRPVFG